MKQIRYGLEKGVDVSIYAGTKYSWQQMEWIRFGLEDKLDVSIYTGKKYDWKQMYYIRLGLEEELNVSVYTNPNYSTVLMDEIYYALRDNEEIHWLDALTDFSKQHPEYKELSVERTIDGYEVLYKDANTSKEPIAIFSPSWIPYCRRFRSRE